MMTQEGDGPDLRALSWPLRLTLGGLWAEQIVRALWPLMAVLMVVFAVLSFNILSGTAVEIAWLSALAASVAVIAGIVYAVRVFRAPTRADALDRLDRSLPGRPISAVLDEQVMGAKDAGSQLIWRAHVERMKSKLDGAEAVSPDLRVSNRDPYALRYVALLGFVIALLFGSIWRGAGVTDLVPGVGQSAASTGPSWEIWIEPPSYTGKPALYLNEVDRAELSVPKGSDLTVRLYGQVGAVTLDETVSGGAGQLDEPETAFTRTITKSGTIAIAGASEREWALTTIPDARPTIRHNGEVDRSPEGEMQLGFDASDDYGVTQGQAHISLNLSEVDRRFGLIPDPEPREAISLDLPMPLSGDRSEFSETLIENLAQHPWAGLPVEIELSVTDALDQRNAEETVEVVLPGRRFFQPVAKAVIEQRRDILWSRANMRRVEQVLRTITHAPEGFFPNESAYLIIRMALTRMELSRNAEMTAAHQEELADALWRAAVLIEDGRFADALERLRQAQEKLSDAMREGATDEEIAELMQELAEAMQDYMQQLAQESDPSEQQAQNQQGQSITQDQLQQMMDEIQRLMEEGRMDEAEQLLSELMEMMQNMQVARNQQGQGQQGEGQQAMEDLQETLRDQQGLSDEAFRDLQEQFNPGAQSGQSQENEGRNGGEGRGQQHDQPGGQGQAQNQGEGQQGQNPGAQPGQQGQGGAENDGSLADRQQSLRNELNRQRQNLPGAGTPEGDAARDALGRAGRAMERAEDALRDDRTADALGAQSDAMDALRDGLQALGEALAQDQQQQQGGQQGQAQGQNSPQGRDPLGRETGSNGSISGTENDMLNGEDARRRSRDLLDEIRKRSGDQQRPEFELEYLKRLLDRL